eukprot:CAMPEP_0118638088 /NCGR_PEP_ID=MMETSP0785-20121206/3495_1 /TAXON_ID=91992 /ORGANISM="Bolidomonas pacifica, Strain CCMP 1866" /LENGTH=174 /DNA_ID=CAMNT_0006529309 /DNA_START=388 /DNA_END=909 /DNA_ORIENTATION=+
MPGTKYDPITVSSLPTHNLQGEMLQGGKDGGTDGGTGGGSDGGSEGGSEGGKCLQDGMLVMYGGRVGIVGLNGKGEVWCGVKDVESPHYNPYTTYGMISNLLILSTSKNLEFKLLPLPTPKLSSSNPSSSPPTTTAAPASITHVISVPHGHFLHPHCAGIVSGPKESTIITYGN